MIKKIFWSERVWI